MLAGDFEGAWQQSDALRARNASDPYRFWDGKELAGKRVMVRCLHGFGDAVQMLRYAPQLAEAAAEVTYEVAPRLVELARCFAGVHQVITWGDQAPSQAPVWDSQVEIMELPYIFRTTLDTLPVAERYIDLPVAALQDTAQKMQADQRPRVGLVWTAGEWNPTRSLSFALMKPLLAIDRISFWNLQGGDAAMEAAASVMQDAAAICGEGLLALAATIANLDLVITVDTLAAHLAGALGKPTWLMLQHTADWRWMSDREHSPWYRTMRLFRQPQPGDWRRVVEALTRALTSKSC